MGKPEDEDRLTEPNSAVSTSRNRTRRAPLSPSRMRAHEHSGFRVASRPLGSIEAAASASSPFHVRSDVVVPLVSLRTAIPLHFTVKPPTYGFRPWKGYRAQWSTRNDFDAVPIHSHPAVRLRADGPFDFDRSVCVHLCPPPTSVSAPVSLLFSPMSPYDDPTAGLPVELRTHGFRPRKRNQRRRRTRDDSDAVPVRSHRPFP